MSHTATHILGAGLTGMSAALHLEADCVVYERLRHAGGHAVTDEDSGYRFDRTGHLLHLRDPDIRSWIESLLGDELLQVTRNSKVFSQGVYTRYPYQANTFGLPPEVAHECVLGFIKAQAAPGNRTVGNFEDFCLEYFGEGFSKHFMIPYNSKLWGVHPRQITAEWCSRFVPRPTLEDVVAGAVGLNDRELGYNANFLYPSRGIGQLAVELARQLEGKIRYQSAPRAIDWRRKRLLFDTEEVPYEVLISTAPLDRLVSLLVDPPTSVADAGGKLRCTALYYLDVALEVPCQVNLHWVYVPEEKYPFYRVGCYSNFSAAMAPPGKSCLYVELASRSEPLLAEILPDVVAGLIDMRLIESPNDVGFARLRRLDHAYVVYDHDYLSSLESIQPFLKEQRILSTGRYGGWNYSSMEDALVFGRTAAAEAESILS